MTYSFAFAVLWAAWIVSWTVGALWASKPQARPPEKDERFYWALTAAGAVLLAFNFSTGRWELVWSNPRWIEWVLLGIATLGLAFTWWARIHLGTLWSGRITRKADHRIVDTRTVRHCATPDLYRHSGGDLCLRRCCGPACSGSPVRRC